MVLGHGSRNGKRKKYGETFQVVETVVHKPSVEREPIAHKLKKKYHSHHLFTLRTEVAQH